MSNAVSPPMTMKVVEVTIAFLSCGSVMCRNCFTRPAPSISAASYRLRGIARAAPW